MFEIKTVRERLNQEQRAAAVLVESQKPQMVIPPFAVRSGREVETATVAFNEMLQKIAKQIGTKDFIFRYKNEVETVRLCYYMPGNTALCIVNAGSLMQILATKFSLRAVDGRVLTEVPAEISSRVFPSSPTS